ncbi:MAG: hypothetical protein A3G34_08635 [Candidatus Lindowbacteria bacterium RIFCSPLOWO2_12_FULL_62_27]|nr:MAG: hypothetical protein A3G34_08635 [Candidatus Lindowbacteria bacterium RIFCSPLOWO2_12_FULL_62_27]
MKLHVYLDTSIISAYFDERLKERQTETRRFWKRIGDFDVSTAEITRQEILQTTDGNLKSKMEGLIEGFSIHSLTEEMQGLAQRYVDSGVFTPVMRNDALHVAASVLTRQDILLSWNFKHLVNRRRRAKVNDVNISLGLPTIEILSPPEI